MSQFCLPPITVHVNIINHLLDIDKVGHLQVCESYQLQLLFARLDVTVVMKVSMWFSTNQINSKIIRCLCVGARFGVMSSLNLLNYISNSQIDFCKGLCTLVALQSFINRLHDGPNSWVTIKFQEFFLTSVKLLVLSIRSFYYQNQNSRGFRVSLLIDSDHLTGNNTFCLRWSYENSM